MAKRMIIMLVSLSVLFGLITVWYFFKKSRIASVVSAMQHATITVSTTAAKTQDWTPFIPATGSLAAANGVNVSPQTSGIISKVNFQSGTFVEKGDSLINIDDRQEQANLKDYEAQLLLAQETYQRDAQLLKDGAISKSTIDSDFASLQKAEANVESTKVSIAYKHVTAPFSGKLGINQINLGQYIQQGSAIVSLQALDPLLVNFTLPEKNLSQLNIGQKVDIIADAYPDHIYHGEITALDSQISSETRSISIEATIKNDNLKLLPGMFTHIKVMLPMKNDVIILPQTAINYELYGDSVFVATKDNDGKLTAKLVYVTTGERRGNVVEITKGVKAGDQVISSGQLKLSDGEAITINNSVEP